MSLQQLLSDLNISEGTERGVGGVVAVLSELGRRLQGDDCAAEGILREVEAVFRLGSACWLFPDRSSGLQEVYVELISTAVRCAELPACSSDSGTLPGSSYEHIPQRARAVGSTLLTLSERIKETERSADTAPAAAARTVLRALTPRLCLFCFTHLEQQPWTEEASRQSALRLLSSVLSAAKCESLLHMLCGGEGGEGGGMMSSILNLLLPQLTKENWKRNEAVKHVFSWLLVQVGRPWITDYLEKVFPPSLLISDDYSTENKVLGVHCLHHIVLNVPAADLRQFNRAQVLYDALFNHLYTSDAPLIQVVLPCLIDLLSVLEKPLHHTAQPRQPNRFDFVLRLILTHMEMEHKVALRRIYASNLLLFVEKMGIGITRHLKRLERVIVGYLEVSDGPEEQARLNILQVLEKTIQSAWPRMESRTDVLAKSLLRFLIDVSADLLDSELEGELIGRALRCLLLLDHCSNNKLMVQLREVDGSCAPERVLKSIKALLPPDESLHVGLQTAEITACGVHGL